MNTLTKRNSHRQRILYTCLRTHADTVSHRHSWSEVSVRQALRSKTLHKCTYNRIRPWVPACCYHTNGICFLVYLVKTVSIFKNLCVNIERVNSVDTERKNLLCIFLTTAGRSSKNGYINILQFCDVANNRIV